MNQSSKSKRKRKRQPQKSFLDGESLISVLGFPSTIQPKDRKDDGSHSQSEMQRQKQSPGQPSYFPEDVVSTQPAASFLKQLFLDRFRKEIVDQYKVRPVAKATRNVTHCLTVTDGKLRRKKAVLKASTSATNEGSVGNAVRHDGHESKPADDSSRREQRSDQNEKKWRRLLIGTNQCTRALDKCMMQRSQRMKGQDDGVEADLADPDDAKPSLIVMARDIYPPTMLCHVPVQAKALGIPLLMLPGKASHELGEAMGMKKASVIAMVPNPADPKDLPMASFVDFIASEMKS